MINLLNAKIIFNKKVSKEYYNLRLLAEPISVGAQPGQFINIKINPNEMSSNKPISFSIPFLRRPMSIYKIDPPFIEVLYKVKGQGTEILSKKEKGEVLNIMGPLGNGFNLNEDFKVGVLVGGGYGISPLVALNQKLQSLKKKVVVIIGAKTKDLLYIKDFKKVKISTEDGSLGAKGVVTDLLNKVCKVLNKKESIIFACGPREMLKRVSLIAQKNKIRCQVSIEELMGCGIGVCLSCVCAVKSKGKMDYKRVCVDGPVFNAGEIIW